MNSTESPLLYYPYPSVVNIRNYIGDPCPHCSRRSEIVCYSGHGSLFYLYLTWKSFLDYTVNNWEATKPFVPTPDSTGMPLLPIICTTLYTLARLHEQAQKDALERAMEMHPYDVIFKVPITSFCDRISLILTVFRLGQMCFVINCLM
jgi:hypothetical protein